ncbi:MAG: Gfo/Idh/MocA family protein, partial [Planctomycetota bacterium]
DPAGRLRNWVFDKALSGDIITEQNVHTLDVMSWIMGRPPLSATGACSRKVRTDIGDCNDSFSLVYRYPKNVAITFSSRQFNAHGSEPSGIRNRVFGSAGTLETKYGGQVLLRGDNFYRGGLTSAIYKEGAVNNIAAFRQSIETGDFANVTAAPSVRSTLVSILGRTAAYNGRQVTWDQLLKKNEGITTDLSGLRA